ncbi:MAG: hypothetical protein P9L99_20330 [Candidatus Lernaella stagnicola]|nr:hypothetical protein [Candidatus Lernaella stagnicola]
MRTKWFLILTILLAAFAMIIACGGGDDDDDDDDTPGVVSVSAVNQSACLDDAESKAIWDPYADPIDVVQVAWDDGVLKVEDLFAYVNCCAEMAVTADAAGSQVTITEVEGGEPCDCMCPIDLTYEIDGLTGGSITLTVQRSSFDTKVTYSVFQLDLELGATNKKWVVPLVDLFTNVEGNAPFQVRYAACEMYNLPDQQFMVRSYGDSYHVFSYDWYDIDNPGTPDPNCQIPVTIDIDTLDAGDYHFGAPLYDRNTEEWDQLNFDVTI